MTTSPAVFLDKDGTLIEDVPYNVDPDLIKLALGAEEGLVRLRDAGYRIFVVSNQSGVALGYFPESALIAVEDRLRDFLDRLGVSLEGFYYCPHLPSVTTSNCDCRKPAPGMILQAARKHGIDLARSWLIGDILDDVEAGRRAGCRTILIDNGNETEWILTPDREPDFSAPDLAMASRLIAASTPLGHVLDASGAYA